jgi:carboxymethylenebutenolidase
MSRKIALAAADGHRLDVWRSDPTGKPKGGIVLLHAIYGLTGHMGDVCDMFARTGYAAIAPALYDRSGRNRVFGYDPEGQQAGRTAYQALTKDHILADIAACAVALRPTGKVAISGFCTGGTWAWIASAELDFDAQVNFYGSHVPARLEYSPACPTVMHYGDSDHVVPLPDIENIRAARPDVTIHVYPGAGHAFFNPEQASHDADAVALAFHRSVDFLDGHLAGRR